MSVRGGSEVVSHLRRSESLVFGPSGGTVEEGVEGEGWVVAVRGVTGGRDVTVPKITGLVVT